MERLSRGIFLRFVSLFLVVEAMKNNLMVNRSSQLSFMGWKIDQHEDLAICSCCQGNSSTCADFIDDSLTQWRDNFAVVSKGVPRGRKTSRKVDLLILLLDKYRRRWVRKMVEDVKKSFFWEVSNTKILVVTFTSNSEDCGRVVEVFSEENIPKMALLLPNTSFLTHNKFTSGEKMKLLPPEATLEDVFPDKMKDLNGFKFRVSQYGIFPRSMVIDDHVYGFDGHLLDTLVESLNSTYHIMAPGFSPDIFFRTIDDVLTDKADFNFNLRILFERSYQEAELSWLYPLRVNSICVVVPHAPQRSVVDAILEPLLSFPSLLYLIFMVLVWVAWMASVRRDPLTIVFNVVRITALSPLPRLQGTRTESVLLVSSLFLSFFFINRLQSIVTAFLVWPGFDENINTVAQLNASKWAVLIPEGVLELIETVDHGYDEYFLREKFIESDRRPDHARYMEPEELNGFAVYGFNVDQRVLNVANQDGTQPLLHLMEECIFHSIASYVFQKHSPFVAPFDRVMQHIQEAGLLTRWRDIADREIIHLNRSMDRLFDNIEYHSRKLHLRFKDLYFTFFLYYVGGSLATLVFAVELLVHHRQQVVCLVMRLSRYIYRQETREN